MKPRNDKQRQILAMSGQLRPLTTAQKQCALTHTIDNYALKYKKGKAVCLICGKEFEAEEGKCTCPHCKAKVEVKTTTHRVIRERSYFNIITAVKGFQVVRKLSDFLCLVRQNPYWFGMARLQIIKFIMDSSDFYHRHASKQKCTHKIQDNRQVSEKTDTGDGLWMTS